MQAQLTQVPRILELLERGGTINHDVVEQVLQAIEQDKVTGAKPRFAGEILLDLKVKSLETQQPISEAEIKQGLKMQAGLKVEACVKDMQAIIQGEALEVPQWLKPQWGSNGVNPAVQNPSIEDGMSAAANMAQNLLLLANQSPAIAKDAQNLVIKLAHLTQGMMFGDTVRTPISKKGLEWMDAAEKGFKPLVEASGVELKDNAGKTVDLDQYCQARFGEMKHALQQALSLSEGQQQGASR